MARGRSNAAIAEALFVSYGAVEQNVAAIFAKLSLMPGMDLPYSSSSRVTRPE